MPDMTRACSTKKNLKLRTLVKQLTWLKLGKDMLLHVVIVYLRLLLDLRFCGKTKVPCSFGYHSYSGRSPGAWSSLGYRWVQIF